MQEEQWAQQFSGMSMASAPAGPQAQMAREMGYMPPQFMMPQMQHMRPMSYGGPQVHFITV
jgi:hypothetical protein